MDKFSVDFESIETSLKKRAYKLSEVADKIEKVAFDLVKFKDGNFDELWRIESGEDGAYIVALYENEDDKITATASAQSSIWNIILKNADLNIFYKGDYLCKVSASSLGFASTDLELACKYLPNKLSSNKNLRMSLLDNMSNEAKKNILAKYPELA